MATPKKATAAEPDEKKVLQAQADQLFNNAEKHAPSKPERLDHVENGGASFGAPVAQGMNISKEEAEYAANLSKSSPEDLQPEKTPASTEVVENK